jgi:5'-3' exonuclease
MIIIDLSQVMIANFMSQVGNHTDTTIDEGLFRHMVLNSIRAIKTKFKDYGEVVIACDDKNPWRRQQFSFYKANRKKNRDESDVDWGAIFNTLNKIKLELKEFFPYRVVQVEGAEADDVIGVLTKHVNPEPVIIVSGDKDFRQLQKFTGVRQYDPVNKRFIDEDKPFQQLMELIIRGDRGDGIPNVLSDDNCILTNTRQKPISKKKLGEWLERDPEVIFNTEELKRNWNRNKTLIDLSCTPENIVEKILTEYDSESNKPKDKIFGYMINNKMKQLLEHINEF